MIGAGAALTVDLGATGTPSGVVTLKAAGTRPTVTASAGAAFTVSANSLITGLRIDPYGTAQGINCPNVSGVTLSNLDVTDTGTASTGDAIHGSSCSATLSNVDVTTQSASGMVFTTASNVTTQSGCSISTTGGASALDATTMAGGSLDFDSVSATDPTAAGISFSGAATFNAPTGSITTSTSAYAVHYQGGTAAFTYGGSLSKSAAGNPMVQVVQHCGANAVTFSGNLTTTGSGTQGIIAGLNSGGTIAFTGTSKALSGSGTSVLLSSNSGATFQFTGGGLVASSAAGSAFTATGGGTVTVSGSGNTLSAGVSGAALNVQNTTTNGLTFQSISDTGGATGIVLDNTGSGAALTVTGDATTARNTSGGSITGSPAALMARPTATASTEQHRRGEHSKQMRVTGSQNNGILASAASAA